LRARLTNRSESRFAFIISNKIEKRATRRNALRRRLRAAIREMLPLIKKSDVLIIAKSPIPYPYDYARIVAELKILLQKAGLLHD